MASEEDTVYCLCRLPYDESRFMIECDICKDWFHGSCVGIQEYQATDIEIYHCPNCQVTHGPLVLKKRRNWHRHDYSEADENTSKGVQTGTVVFIKELKNRSFPSADEIPIIHLRNGHELTTEYLRKNGFDHPILVHQKDGLGLKVPPPNFTIQDVELHVGSMRELDVIDVLRQEDCKMLMREWTEYYNSPNRTKIFNVISLEFSGTKLAELVEPPEVVRKLSWVSKYWPEDVPEDAQYVRPEVQRYCLMGVKDSFTDFHVDFGGTSVWYHVLKGEKLFYMIKPTATNLALYETWLSSANQSEMFFGDQVDICYRCVVKTGQTLFIPTGWIHAVLTPIDSLVFGGNFLHSLNLELQLAVYEIEKRVKTPEKYLFPNFETLNWYAGKHILDEIKEFHEEGKPAPVYLLNGAHALATSLKSWTAKKDFVKAHKDAVPETIQYGKLLKELMKEVKLLQGDKVKKEEDKKKKSKMIGSETPGPPVKPSALKGAKGGIRSKVKKEAEQQPMLDVLAFPEKKVTPLSPGRFQKGTLPRFKTHIGAEPKPDKKDVYEFDEPDEELPAKKVKDVKTSLPPAVSAAAPSENPIDLVRIPKAGAFVDPESLTNKEGLALASTALKLKVSGGKIISGSEPGSKPEEADTQPFHAKFRLPAATKEEAKSDSENEESHLVVDEKPKMKKQLQHQMSAPPGPLKLKLSVGRSQSEDSALPPPKAAAAAEGDPENPDGASAMELCERASMPVIRGGLNCSIADILEASGYGTETDFKFEENLDRAASPSMRDAIQGMLSMSRMGGLQFTQTPGTESPFDLPVRGTSRLRQVMERKKAGPPEEGGDMRTCYKDAEFVYPSLDLSDTEEEHIFKPRGRLKKDETWNPKVKMDPSMQKRDRPERQGAKREAVQSGLEDAAQRLANTPRPKRQYVRRKPKPEKPCSPTSEMDPLPGPSGLSLSSSAPASLLRQNSSSKRPGDQLSSPNKVKKPKKGMATAKQRLGKILKIHKMLH